MKNSFKLLAMISGVGLSLSLLTPAWSQTSPGGPSPSTTSPGSNPNSPGLSPNPSTPGLNPNPGVFNEAPYRQQQAQPRQTVSLPMMGQPMSITDITRQSSSFTLLNALLPVAGLDASTLGGLRGADGQQFTVFAPTDAAFAALPEGTIRQLVQPENRDLLIRLLSNHVIPGTVMSQQISGNPVNSLAGTPLTFQGGAAGGISVNNAQIVRPDIQASNGVIHAIDRVIIPPELQTRLGLQPTQTPGSPAL